MFLFRIPVAKIGVFVELVKKICIILFHNRNFFLLSIPIYIYNKVYSDRESNPDLIFRRDLFYPLNYQSPLP